MPNVPPNSPDDDQAVKPDAPGDASAIDKWRDAEIPNAWVAAYHSGRLLNQLWWHAQQHCLLNDLGQLRKVEEVFGKLVGVAFHVTSTSNSSLDTQIKSSLNRYHEHTTSEGVAEAWLACNEAIAEDQRDVEIAIADSWDPEGIWRQARENREWELERLVKTWAWPTVETLRRAFLSALPGDKDLAFELGRLVDQSVRRPDVYLSLWTAPPPTDELSGPIWPDTDGSNGESKSPEELADHGQGTDSPSGESDRASHNAESSPGADDTGSESDSPNRLANHSKEAGSLRPECGWGESTLQICRKLEVPAGRTKAIKELPLRPTREEFLSAVEKADAWGRHESRRQFRYNSAVSWPESWLLVGG